MRASALGVVSGPGHSATSSHVDVSDTLKLLLTPVKAHEQHHGEGSIRDQFSD